MMKTWGRRRWGHIQGITSCSVSLEDKTRRIPQVQFTGISVSVHKPLCKRVHCSTIPKFPKQKTTYMLNIRELDKNFWYIHIKEHFARLTRLNYICFKLRKVFNIVYAIK